MFPLDDTITAIASPPGRSVRGLIRISGPDAVPVVQSICARSHRRIDLERRVARHRLADGTACLLAVYPAPHSYTGEHTIELITAGNPDWLNRLVTRLVDAGARLAEPGEFTARAWMNGKLTLTQAEGVAALIAAHSDAQLHAAHTLTDGRFGTLVDDLAQRLATLLALVEAGIDFTDEEDVVAIAPADLLNGVHRLHREIDAILARSTAREALSHLPTVAIVGAPNAGKSTLFNALLGSRRVVVSDISGTTRDAIGEPMHVDPDDPCSAEILLVDLAGLDPSEHGLNPQMQAVVWSTIDRADLVVHVVAPDVPDHRPDALLPGCPTVVVYSKSDQRSRRSETDALHVSAHTGSGIVSLRCVLADRLRSLTTHVGADAMTLWPRHEEALIGAAALLAQVEERLEPCRGDRHLPHSELLAADLREALDALGQLVGLITPDDVLGRVFASFCVGK